MSDDDRRRILKLQKLGRFLSLLLKHRSARFPLQLDAEGFASLIDIMFILKRLPNFRWATKRDIEAVLELPGPPRFELWGDQEPDTRIRAVTNPQPEDPALEPVIPPDQLLYGTAPERLDVIRTKGIQPVNGAYVQLSSRLATARSLAVRVTPDPLILHINTARAYAAGCHFYATAPGIYLTATVPPQYIEEFSTD